jgi:hypothetical protein
MKFIARIIAKEDYATGFIKETICELDGELEEVFKELKEKVVGTPNEYCEFEPDFSFPIDVVTLYEVVNKTELPLRRWLSEKREIKNEYKKNKKQQKRRKLYEELKAEFADDK